MRVSDYNAVHRAADRHVPALTLVLSAAVGAAREAVPLSALEDALRRGDVAGAEAEVELALARLEEVLSGRPAGGKAPRRAPTSVPAVVTQALIAGAEAVAVCVPEHELHGWADAASTLTDVEEGVQLWARDDVHVFVTRGGEASEASAAAVAKTLDALPKPFLRAGGNVRSVTVTTEPFGYDLVSEADRYGLQILGLYERGTGAITVQARSSVGSTVAHEVGHSFMDLHEAALTAAAEDAYAQDLAAMSAARRKEFVYFAGSLEEAVVESMAEVLVRRSRSAFAKAFPRTVAAVRDALVALGVQ